MKLKVVTCLAFSLLIVAIVVLFYRASNSNATNYPSPNGHDTLLEAGRQIASAPLIDDESPTPEELTAFLEACEGAVPLVQQAMEQECVIPLDTFKTPDELFDSLGPLKATSRLLFAKAKLAILENRPEDAASALLQADRLGESLSNGGLLIHHLLSAAIRTTALSELGTLIGNLTEEQRDRILNDLRSRKEDEASLAALMKETMKLEHRAQRRNNGVIAGSWLIWMSSGMEQGSVEMASNSLMESRTLRDQLLEGVKSDQRTTSSIEDPISTDPASTR